MSESKKIKLDFVYNTLMYRSYNYNDNYNDSIELSYKRQFDIDSLNIPDNITVTDFELENIFQSKSVIIFDATYRIISKTFMVGGDGTSWSLVIENCQYISNNDEDEDDYLPF